MTTYVTLEKVPGGSFVGLGNDTLALIGDRYTLFDLTQATFSGFSTITTDASFSIKMTAAQFATISTINGTWYNSLSVLGPVVDIRNKSISQVFGITIEDNATVYANSLSKLNYVNAFAARGDTLKFDGNLSDVQRADAHKAGFDIVIDNSLVASTNPAPVIANLSGEQKLVVPGQITFLDAGSDAVVTDDQGTIKNLKISAGTSDTLRIVPTERLGLKSNTSYGFDIIFDDIKIGSYSKESYPSPYLSFSFTDNAPSEAVDYILHHVEFVRGSTSRYDNVVTVDVYDKGGRVTTAKVTMSGVDGPFPTGGTPPISGSNNSPTAPTLSGKSVSEFAAAGTVIGTFSAFDMDGDPLSYSISTVSNLYGEVFKVEGNKLVLTGRLDFELRPTYTFVATVSDGHGKTASSSITINVNDVVSETTTGTVGLDFILGGLGNDRLSGGDGNDTISGGVDSDILMGGKGSDYFRFDAKPSKQNIDRIMDFSPKDDAIWLAGSIFSRTVKGVSPYPVQLNKAFFRIGTKAKDKNDYVIYNDKTGKLSYDVDGSGAKKAVDFGQLGKHLKLTYKDFFII